MKIKAQVISSRLVGGEDPHLTLQVEVYAQQGEEEYLNAYTLAPKLPPATQVVLEVEEHICSHKN